MYFSCVWPLSSEHTKTSQKLFKNGNFSFQMFQIHFGIWNNLLRLEDSTRIIHNVVSRKNLRNWTKLFLWLMRSSLFLSFVPNPPQPVHHIINYLEQRQKNESNKLFLVRLSRSMLNCSNHAASCTKINPNLLTFPDVV